MHPPIANNLYTQRIQTPVLMCFICKLSFGIINSFTLHASAVHNLTLGDLEKYVLHKQGHSSAIIQTNKDKKIEIAFLKPMSNNIRKIEALKEDSSHAKIVEPNISAYVLEKENKTNKNTHSDVTMNESTAITSLHNMSMELFEKEIRMDETSLPITAEEENVQLRCKEEINYAQRFLPNLLKDGLVFEKNLLDTLAINSIQTNNFKNTANTEENTHNNVSNKSFQKSSYCNNLTLGTYCDQTSYVMDYSSITNKKPTMPNSVLDIGTNNILGIGCLEHVHGRQLELDCNR